MVYIIDILLVLSTTCITRNNYTPITINRTSHRSIPFELCDDRESLAIMRSNKMHHFNNVKSQTKAYYLMLIETISG